MAESIETTGEDSTHAVEVANAKELVLRRVNADDEEMDVIEAMPMPGEDIMVFARTPGEMALAQDRLIEWGHHKVAYLEKELEMAKENLEAAKEAKIKTRPWMTLTRKAQRKLTYYRKVTAALEAGYYIVPDFPINVVAVRTKKKMPSDAGNMHHYASSVKDEKAQGLPIGEGAYVNPDPQHWESTVNVEKQKYNSTEKEIVKEKRYTTCREFDEIDFPLRLVRPQVIKHFTNAMKRKIFDTVGVLPNTRRNADPMIVGTIEMKEGYNTKRLSFLISWWIPTQSL